MNRRRFGVAALALIAAVFALVSPNAASAAGADSPPSGIKGKVFQPPANPGQPPQPVAEATVRLVRNGQVVAETQTDEQGRYAFPNIQPGRYRVGAFKAGVGHGVRHTIVFPAQIVTIPILLQP